MREGDEGEQRFGWVGSAYELKERRGESFATFSARDIWEYVSMDTA